MKALALIYNKIVDVIATFVAIAFWIAVIKAIWQAV